MKRAFAFIWRPALVLLALFGAWELYVDLGGADPLILPPPHQIASSMYNDRGLLWSNFLVTGKEIVLGILVATAAGFVLAVAIHTSETLRKAFYPLLISSQTIPFSTSIPPNDGARSTSPKSAQASSSDSGGSVTEKTP